MPQRLPTRLVHVAAMTGLLFLPSCLTAALWSDYAWPAPTTSTTMVGQNTTALEGRLRASLPALTNGLWWQGSASQPWFLHPGDGVATEVAAALLAEPGFCHLQYAEIAAVREFVNEEVEHNDAYVLLRVQVARDAIAAIPARSEVSPWAMRLLAEDRQNAFLDSGSPDAALPALHRACARRLSRVDCSWLTGTSLPARATSWVFVTDDGTPVLTADDLEPADDTRSNAPLAEQLARLRKLSLLVRVQHGDEATILRLQPDRLWLLAELDVANGSFEHRSSWRLQRVPSKGAEPPSAESPHCFARLVLFETQWQRLRHPVWFDTSLVARIAITPVALALDLALGPGAGVLLEQILGGKSSAGRGQGKSGR